MRDFLEFFAPLILVLTLGFAGILLLCNWYGSYQCGQYQSVTGKPTKWVVLDQCYVETSDGWQRWDEYKIRAAASEGLKRAP